MPRPDLHPRDRASIGGMVNNLDAGQLPSFTVAAVSQHLRWRENVR
ncbi:hypothetical protein Pan216_31190 [Planctomycetes bacterium Pan216]|uniref:Uncharacterized protein n=1 Tax=Kolteria novifilia TaxID=2527975 RepID=A0A518B5N3_9BACT|nr:hypothetical protein Pan216_31190 [Planctomycetes bacterium Pan216]